jgi:hypothetical protein
MLQFTKDNTFTLTTTNGFVIPDGTLITGFVRFGESTTTYWYYQVDWFIGGYSDYPPNDDFLFFKELPFDFKVPLFNPDTSPIYTIPSSLQTNYNEVIDKASYPLQQYIMDDPESKIDVDLSGKLNIVFT